MNWKLIDRQSTMPRVMIMFLMVTFFSNNVIAQTNVWQWVKGSEPLGNVFGRPGVSSPYSKPGKISDACTWVDKKGNYWMFSGFGDLAPLNESSRAGHVSDLWKYDPTINQWTWVSGDGRTMPYERGADYGIKGVASFTNFPGPRHGGGNMGG